MLKLLTRLHVGGEGSSVTGGMPCGWRRSGREGERERGREGGRVREWTFDADGSDSFLADFSPLLIVCPSAMIKNDAMYHTMMTAWAAKMLCSKGENRSGNFGTVGHGRRGMQADAPRQAHFAFGRLSLTT